MSKDGALLIDGAAFESIMLWLSQRYPDHPKRCLLLDTAYAPLMELGPVLLHAPEGSEPHRDWSQGREGLQDSVWLETRHTFDQVFASLRHRLRIHSPDGREFWLRMADARPLRLAWQAEAQWPEGFWPGVACLWLRNEDGTFPAWVNEDPNRDCAKSGAQIVLDWSLLDALTQDNPEEITA